MHQTPVTIANPKLQQETYSRSDLIQSLQHLNKPTDIGGTPTATFSGSPKVYTTSLSTNPGSSPTLDTSRLKRDFRSGVLPFTPAKGSGSANADYGFSATGKISFPSSGTYTFRIWHDDGMRLYIDDKAVIDDWNYRSEGVSQKYTFGSFTAEKQNLQI